MKKDSFDWDDVNGEKIWTAENIQELGSDFLRLMLANMQHHPDVTVRIDRQVSGYQPMYQVTLAQGTRLLFSGTHDESAPNKILHLSEALSYQQVEDAYRMLEDEHKAQESDLE